ncbi:hypothetical protein OF83DRAFT_1086406, partial [Amylostereum chailletii]
MQYQAQTSLAQDQAQFSEGQQESANPPAPPPFALPPPEHALDHHVEHPTHEIHRGSSHRSEHASTYGDGHLPHHDSEPTHQEEFHTGPDHSSEPEPPLGRNSHASLSNLQGPSVEESRTPLEASRASASTGNDNRRNQGREKGKENTSAAFATVDATFAALASSTDRSVDRVVRSYMKEHNRSRGKSRAPNMWNQYQAYFRAFREEEEGRIKQQDHDGSSSAGDDGGVGDGLNEEEGDGVVSRCYDLFRKEHGENFPEILENFSVSEQFAAAEAETAHRRTVRFQKWAGEKQVQADREAMIHNFETLSVVAGSMVNSDGLLCEVITLDGFKGFLEKNFDMDLDEFCGYAKSHVYGAHAKHGLGEWKAHQTKTRTAPAPARFEPAVARADADKTFALEDRDSPLPLLDQEPKLSQRVLPWAHIPSVPIPTEKTKATLIKWLRESLDVGLKVKDKGKSLPWKMLAKTLLDGGLILDNYPNGVQLPGDSSKGINALSVVVVKKMWTQIEDPDYPCRIRPTTPEELKLMEAMKFGVVMGVPPPRHSSRARGRALNGRGVEDSSIGYEQSSTGPVHPISGPPGERLRRLVETKQQLEDSLEGHRTRRGASRFSTADADADGHRPRLPYSVPATEVMDVDASDPVDDLPPKKRGRSPLGSPPPPGKKARTANHDWSGDNDTMPPTQPPLATVKPRPVPVPVPVPVAGGGTIAGDAAPTTPRKDTETAVGKGNKSVVNITLKSIPPPPPDKAKQNPIEISSEEESPLSPSHARKL